jgi:hypothetical protein
VVDGKSIEALTRRAAGTSTVEEKRMSRCASVRRVGGNNESWRAKKWYNLIRRNENKDGVKEE